MEVVSETKDETNPIIAFRANFSNGFSFLGIYSCKVLKVKNQGKCPTAVAEAAAAKKIFNGMYV